MLPSLFNLLRADAAVTAILGTAPMRFYRHGAAPQQPPVTTPYVTQVMISGVPALQLDGLPPLDTCRIQVSCWSTNGGTGPTAVNTLAGVVRDCIEQRWHITDIRDMGQDPDTMRFRVDLDVTIHDMRAAAVSPIENAIGDEDGGAIGDEDGGVIGEEVP